MKKILLILAAFATLLVPSCINKNEADEVPFMKGTFYPVAFSDVDIVVTMPKVTKVIDLRAYADTLNGSVASDNATITFGVNPDLVDVYNSAHGTNYKMAPNDAYEFTTGDVTLYKYNVRSTTGAIKVGATQNMDMTSVYLIPVVISAVSGPKEYEIPSDKAAYILLSRAFSPFNNGSGSVDDPYVIMTAEEMLKIEETLIEGSTIYYKLGADIDMSSIGDWNPINNVSPYQKKIDFDGDGHTLSNLTCRADAEHAGNAGLFGVLWGEVRNLNITNAALGNTANKYSSGIIAAFGGYLNNDVVMHASAINCHVQGTIRSSQYGNAGIFGRGYGVTVERCSADVDIVCSTHHNAGILGYVEKTGGNTIKNCYSTGTITGTRFSAGIAAYIADGGGNLISNCYSTVSATSTNHGGGGIVGRIDNKTTDPDAVIDCISWNEKIELTVARTDANYSVGAIVGDCYGDLKENGAPTNITLKGGLRRADLDFKATAPSNVLADQGDFDENNPLTGPGTTSGVSGGHIFPYHGKAVAAGTTCSQAAKQLGWDETIWDLSGDLPKLR